MLSKTFCALVVVLPRQRTFSTNMRLLHRYYCLSILDKHHHPDINLGQGIKLLNMCTDELKRRLPIDFKGMTVKVVTKNGIQDIEFDDDKVVKMA